MKEAEEVKYEKEVKEEEEVKDEEIQNHKHQLVAELAFSRRIATRVLRSLVNQVRFIRKAATARRIVACSIRLAAAGRGGGGGKILRAAVNSAYYFWQ